MKGRTHKWICLAVLMFSLVIFSDPAEAKTITVDDDGPADFNSIQAAIDDANDRDVVVVQQGIYTGEGNRDIDFLGKAITVRSTDPNDSQVIATTIIDGGGDSFDLHHGFIFKSGESRDTLLAGLTITNFYARPELVRGGISSIELLVGGGIFCRGSSPTIACCAVTSNSSWDMHSSIGDAGGGIYCDDNSSPRIYRCTIRANRSYTGTGGIHCYGGEPAIEQCTISGNTSAWGWGGVCCSTAAIRDCTISDNDAGGICCGGNSIVNNCIIGGNRQWGGIYAWGNTMVSRSVITGNHQEPNPFEPFRGAGGIDCEDSVTISHCIVAGNWSKSHAPDEFGGKIDGNGGGVYCHGGSPTIVSCTIAGNSADDYGGGIYCASGNPTIINCILWQNRDPNDQQIGGKTSVSYSNVEGGFAGQGNIDAAPCFADPNNGDYHLKSQAGRWDEKEGRWTKDDVTSSCIDAGDPMSPIGHEPFPNGGVINMGAYGGTSEGSKSYFGEPICEVIIAGDINGDCIIDFKDFTLMALHWLECVGPNQGGWCLVEDDTEDSYSCEGNFDIFYPCSDAVDEDWDTYALPADLGATSYIYENYIIPSGIATADFRIKYQQTASVTPGLCTTVTDYGDGNTWTELNCTALSNQISTLTVRIPHDALNRTTLQLRTRVWKSRGLPGSGSGMYYEGKVIWYFLPVCETIIAGDINGDCRVDWADFMLMARHWLH